MTTPMESLTGVEILIKPTGEPSLDDQVMFFLGGNEYTRMLDAKADVLESARELGAKVVEDSTEGDPEFHREFLTDPHHFCVDASAVLNEEKSAEFFEGLGKTISRPWHAPYRGMDTTQLAMPFVLAAGLDGGQGKYLIENEDQLQKFKALNEHFAHQAIDSLFEVREFIPTPSDHYTSYRVVTSATGEILAAGLLYSAHAKSEEKRVAVAPHDDWERAGSSITEMLENPATPFFMNARDVRSNLQQGGTCIPLLGGDNARRITNHEEEILEAHGISPFQVVVPEALQQASKLIGTSIGKYYGLVMGIDYIQDARTGEQHLLEINAGPGGQTFTECWFNGDRDIDEIDAFRALLAGSVASLSVVNAVDYQP